MINRTQILNHLAQVTSNTIAGDCIRIFVQDANNKTDEQVIQTILDLQDQIKDNRSAMKQVLGKQFHFINSFKTEQCLSPMQL